MTEAERKVWKERIENMSHLEMASLWRFSPVGHPIFNKNNGLFEVFEARFKKFGGMTVSISKKIGW